MAAICKDVSDESLKRRLYEDEVLTIQGWTNRAPNRAPGQADFMSRLFFFLFPFCYLKGIFIIIVPL